MSLRCFVAMAFGQEDTDQLYKFIIKPVLDSLEVRPVRVDKLNYNSNIDMKILDEIKKCDIAFVDLTYARPSVYFEAGFAERNVPVIYSARDDHLKQDPDDEEGNEVVHFDLKMRNLLLWKKQSDGKYKNQLNKRMRVTIAPILRDKEKNKKNKAQKDNFYSRSLNARIEQLVKISSATLKLNRFNCEDLQKLRAKWLKVGFENRAYFQDAGNFALQQYTRLNLIDPGTLGTKLSKNNLTTISVHIRSGFTKRNMDNFSKYFLVRPIYNIRSPSIRGNFKGIVDHIFFVSFRKVPDERIMNALFEFEKL
ncbi:MAG: hypothetical protein HN720_10200, partial [Nitrospinaceae bacterium]|nr:hypothetical protein [Nitrospinaceae bacterium]